MKSYIPTTCALLALLSAPATSARIADAGPVEVRTLASPAGADTGESNLHRSPDGTLHLTWCGPGTNNGDRALYLSSLAPDADAWTEPQTVVSTPLLMENWADFPSVARGTDGTLWAQWFQQRGKEGGHGYSGWFARSADGGANWSAPAELGHEFVSLAPISGGRVVAVWLESLRVSREQRAPGVPTMSLRSRLMTPHGGTLDEWTIDPDVCTCCQTSLAVLPDDRVFVAYRGHTSGEIRDNLHATFYGDGWTAPQLINVDGWKIAACPVNGPAVDALGRSLATVWFTAADGIARVLARTSHDAGASFGPPTRVDLGRPMGRVDVAMLADGSAILTWMEAKTDEKAAGIFARRIFPDGGLSQSVLVAESSQARASGFPRIASRGDTRILMSYTEEGAERRVRTLEFDMTAAVRQTAQLPFHRESTIGPEFGEVTHAGSAGHH